MASTDEVQRTLLESINKSAENNTNPGFLLKLAEALAWVQYPNQPHGGGVEVSK